MRTLVRDGHVLWSEQTGEPRPVKATLMRRYRNALLKECDWTQVADAPVNAEAWATYRQALRDVPQQEGFPETIEWPEAPA